MGRIKKKRAVRDARRQPGARSAGPPPFPRAEVERIGRAWDQAVDSALIEDGAETKYHFTLDGKVLSVAVGKGAQVRGILDARLREPVREFVNRSVSPTGWGLLCQCPSTRPPRWSGAGAWW